MAFATVTKPTYPDVPAFAGVPALTRAIGAVVSATALVTQAAALLGLVPPSWGIFDTSGNQALSPDSFLGIEFTKEYQVPTSPIEQGAFASYNKVAIPFDARISFAKGGSVEERGAFLSTVAAIVDGTDLYSIVTPEISYAYANPIRYTYRRQQRNGATLIIIELFVQEIRLQATTTYSSTAQPSGAATVNGGTVQTSTSLPGVYFPGATASTPPSSAYFPTPT